MIKLAEIFQNKMTLQRGKKIRLWGESDATEQIAVQWNGRDIFKGVILAGKFVIKLPPMAAEEDGTLTITTKSQKIVFSQVDIGEVWIAGGQSNMEFLLKYDRESDAMISGAADDHFRFYDVGEYAFEGERALGNKDGSHWDRWVTYNPTDAPYFSAVGTYFALKLRKSLGVPVAVVGCNWGGTSASAWVKESILRKDPALSIYTDRFDKAIRKIDLKKYKEKMEKPNAYAQNPKVMEEVDKRMKNEILQSPGLLTRIVGKIIVATYQMGPYSENRPGGLFETMLLKIAGYSAAGFLWYQGESDYKEADIYDRLLKAVIRGFRREWKDVENQMPFLLVQLTSYEGWKECSGENYHIIRQMQQKVADEEPNVHLASIMDVGSRYDIHPKEKRPVGERLALLAERYAYGENVQCEAPRIEKAVKVGDKIMVTFAYAREGLTARGDCSDAFYLTTDEVPPQGRNRSDRNRIKVKARAEGNCVILTGDRLADTKEKLWLSFAYRPYCPMRLFSKDRLAARPQEPIAVLEKE